MAGPVRVLPHRPLPESGPGCAGQPFNAAASSLSAAVVLAGVGSVSFVRTAPQVWHQIDAGRSAFAAISVIRLLPHFSQAIVLIVVPDLSIGARGTRSS